MFDKQSIPDCMVVVKTNGNKVTIVEVNELVKLTQSINTSPSARAVEESFSPFFKLLCHHLRECSSILLLSGIRDHCSCDSLV